jgi:hypothetical protein
MDAADREDEKRASAGAQAGRLLKVVVAAVLGGLLALAALRVFITPVAPTQEAPSGHPKLPCAFCHIVSGSIDEVEIP